MCFFATLERDTYRKGQDRETKMDRMDARLGNPFKYDRADGCIGGT